MTKEQLLDEPGDDSPRSETQTRRLLLELQVHQIELELQNEELRLSRSAVEEGLARYTELYDFAPVGYLTFSKEGLILEINLPGARLLGTERAYVLGRPLTRYLPPEKRRAFTEWLEGLFSQTAPAIHNTTLHGKDKTPRAVELEATVSTGGDVARTIVTDITSRLELEEQLRQSQKMDIIGQLAGGVAHDFNNILGAMMLNLDSMEREQGLSPHCCEVLTDLQTLTKRASSLTRQLLQFSRRQTLKRGEIEINSTLRPLLEMLRRVLGEQITYVWRESGQSLFVDGDVAQIEQVVVNLCLNARDAMGGPGTLTIETSSVEFDTGVTQENPHGRSGQFTCVRVSDTGAGMSDEIRNRVFEPFFTTKEIGKGTGLGLASAYGVIEQHDGWITVQSGIGAGTSFRFYLPLSTTVAFTPSTMPPPSIDEPTGQTILIVEDEEALLTICARALRPLGYHVLSARNAAAALALWSEHSKEIDLLVTDMRMPGGTTGLDLAKSIWQTSPSLKVVIMSGYSSETLHDGPARSAGYTFLQKPFDSKTLAQAVRRALLRAPKSVAPQEAAPGDPIH